MNEPKHEPSAQAVHESQATSTGDEELLAALADDFAARLRRGEHPTVEEYAAEHPALAQRIRKVLSAAAMMEQTRAWDVTASGEAPGATIGRYKLLERIGEGGFGVVYMAEQQRPVRRKVALKVIKPGMDSRQVLARFDAERQALALMDHPNIAKIFDGGMTDSGRPYFVMELVRGQPITEFSDQHRLAPRERLDLFAHVCHAVQHAHQKGIIHRDIKPTNVLVMMHDTTPVVKVIDFGVAKALGQELTDKTLFTGFAQFLGTPLYMSPEQAGQSSLDVDTRSDIYSLGVLLYELLTGTTPFDKERFRQAAEDEIRRIIREEEPPKPSTRLSDSKDSLPSISALRHTEPGKLTGLLRGELDWIVMKALEKDRARRYETASGLAMDVQRYLHDEQVLACPPSAGYRLRKVLRRNRVPLSIAAGFLLLLVAAAVVSTYQAIRIGAEQENTLAQKLEADSQRKAAQKNERAATQSERTAQQRLAENLAVTGDALLASREVLRARDAFEQSAEVSKALGISPAVAITGLTQSYLDSPAPLHRLRVPRRNQEEGSLGRAAFSPDGRTIATIDGGLWLWDTLTGRKLQTFQEAGPGLRSVVFSHDARMLLTCGGDITASVWDIASGKRLLHLRGRGPIRYAVFSPDDRRVITGSGEHGNVCVWDVDTGDDVLRMDAGDGVMCVAVSPDGRLIAAGLGGGRLKIWDAITGAPHLTVEQTPGRLGGQLDCVAFTPDSRGVLTADRGRNIRLCDAAQGTELRWFGPTNGYMQRLAFFDDGTRFLSSGPEGIVRVWDVATGAEARRYAVTSVPQGNVALSAGNKSMVSGPLQGPPSDNHEYGIWDIAGETDVTSIGAHDAGIASCAASPDGRLLLTGDWEGTLKLWDVATWQVVRVIPTHESWVHSLCFLPDGVRAMTATQQAVRLWDLRDGRCIRTYPIGQMNHTGNVVAVAPDGRTAVIKDTATTLQMLDVETGVVRHTISVPHQGAGMCAAFSPDGGRVLVGGTHNWLALWNPGASPATRALRGHRWFVTGVAFSPDGNSAVSTSWDCDAIVWDLQKNEPRHVLRGHTSYVTKVVISPDGSVAATAGDDGTVRLWDLRSGAQIRAFSTGTAVNAKALALIDGGNTLVSGSTDGKLRVWRLDWSEQLRERTRRVAQAQRALDDDPDSADALLEIGEWYVFRGKWDWALELLEQAQAQGARVPALSLARCYWKAGRTEEADRMFRLAAGSAEVSADYLELCRDAIARWESPVPGFAFVTRTASGTTRPSAELERLAQTIVGLDDNATWDSPRKAACRRLARWDESFPEKLAELRPDESTLWIGRRSTDCWGADGRKRPRITHE